MSVDLNILSTPGITLTLDDTSQEPVTWTVENELSVNLTLGGQQGVAGARGPAWTPSSQVPSTSTSSGVFGNVAIDNNFLYIATGTNTWRRVALASW